MARRIETEQLKVAGLGEAAARRMAERLNELISSVPAAECWREISHEILTPAHPFALHALLYDTVFSDWDVSQGPPPAWTPTEEFVATTNVARLMNELKLGSYEELHAWSVANRAEFWDAMIRTLGIRFAAPFAAVLDPAGGAESPRWLPGAKFNIAQSCFAAPAESPAIIYQAEGGTLQRLSYGELNSLSNRVAGALAASGYAPGDAIACYMPMTAESVEIYLGIVKAGCVVVSIADSFAAGELATRLRLSRAKGIFTQDFCPRRGKRLPLYEKVIEAGAPPAIVLPAAGSLEVELRDGDRRWDRFLVDDDRFDPVARDPHDHTNVLFSSGTTGDPKAIPWNQTTPIKCAADGWLHHDIRPGDVVAWPTNLGWMMGPWLIYASLVNRATMALHYGAPTSREFCRFVQDARVTMLGLVPSLVRVWRREESTTGLDWSAIRAFSSTGECSNAEDYLYLMSTARYKPVIEYCGGTEIGGGYITGTVVRPAAPATFSTPALGLDFVILDEEGRETRTGEVFLVGPSIGLSTELLNHDHQEVYFEGTRPGPAGERLRRHGDLVERLDGGYFRAHGRADDTMNLGGIKVSSAEIERVLNLVAGVSETAAIAVAPPGGGPEALVVYAVPEPGVSLARDALRGLMQGEIKRQLNPLFRVSDVVVVDSLPRTASGKVMRRTLRSGYGTGG